MDVSRTCCGGRSTGPACHRTRVIAAVSSSPSRPTGSSALASRPAPRLDVGLRGARWDGDDLVLRGWSFVRGGDHGGPARVTRSGCDRRFGSAGRVRARRRRAAEDLDVLGRCRGPSSTTAESTWEARFSAATLAALPRGRWQIRTKVSSGGGRRSWGRVRRIYVFGSPAVMRLRPQAADGSSATDASRTARRPDRQAEPQGVLVRDVTLDGREISLRVDAGSRDRLGGADAGGPGRRPARGDARRRRRPARRRRSARQDRRRRGDRRTGSRRPGRLRRIGPDRKPLTLLDDGLGHRPTRRARSSCAATRTGRSRSSTSRTSSRSTRRARDDDEIAAASHRHDRRRSRRLRPGAGRAAARDPGDHRSVEDGRFTATAPLRVSSWGGPAFRPMRGAYVLEGAASTATMRVHHVRQPGATSTVPTSITADDMRLRFELNQQPQCWSGSAVRGRDDEYGAYNQRILFQRFAYGRLAEPLDAVYFESFFGRSATCNPRAIDAEVARRRPDLPRYWSVDDRSVAVPEGAIPLVIGTREWWRVRESARWIVTNEWLRGRYVKKPFQTVLQTWHGSMYKRIGMDRGGADAQHAIGPAPSGPTGTCSSPRTPTRRRSSSQAYEFEAEAQCSRSATRATTSSRDPTRRGSRDPRAHRHPRGRRVVMYAPTWREAGQNVELLSLVELADELGPDFTFLQRGHVRTLEEGESVAVRHRHRRQHVSADQRPLPGRRPAHHRLLVDDVRLQRHRSADDLLHAGHRGVHRPEGARRLLRPRGGCARPGGADAARGRRAAPHDRHVGADVRRSVRRMAERFNHPDDGHASARAVDALFAFDPKSRSRQLVERYDLEAGAGEDG